MGLFVVLTDYLSMISILNVLLWCRMDWISLNLLKILNSCHYTNHHDTKTSSRGPTMRECLLADSSPVPYPLPRAPMAPLCVCAAPMRLCMSPCPLVIPVDGPTAWLRRTWMASSKRSRRSSIRLCCRTNGHRRTSETCFLSCVSWCSRSFI